MSETRDAAWALEQLRHLERNMLCEPGWPRTAAQELLGPALEVLESDAHLRTLPLCFHDLCKDINRQRREAWTEGRETVRAELLSTIEWLCRVLEDTIDGWVADRCRAAFGITKRTLVAPPAWAYAPPKDGG